MLRFLSVVSAVAIALSLSACASSAPTPNSAGAPDAADAPDAAAVIEQFGLPGDDVVEVIDRLDELPLDERPSELLASVRSDQLVLASGGREASLPMPADLTYVSLAPYVTETHECFFHSLTTCLGEMGDERIDVTIADAATGEVVVNETATTYANGFIGYWLPRDREHVVTVQQGGLAGETRFSTAADGPTCITDLRLT